MLVKGAVSEVRRGGGSRAFCTIIIIRWFVCGWCVGNEPSYITSFCGGGGGS